MKKASVADTLPAICKPTHLSSHVDQETRRVVFRGADAVWANSAHEPFGLVFAWPDHPGYS